MLLHLRQADILGSALDLKVVLYQHAIEQDGDIGLVEIGPVCLKDRRRVDDIVDIPLTGLAHGVDERTPLLVHGSYHAIAVRHIFVVIKYLKLIETLEEDTTVASALARALDTLGHTPLYMELAGTKFVAGLNVTL